MITPIIWKEALTITPIIRWIVTVGLLYKVYGETGIWTTIALGLISICIETGTLGMARYDLWIKKLESKVRTL